MKIFTPNTDFTDDFYEKGRYLLAWRLTLSFVFIFFILSVPFYFIDYRGFYIYLIVFLVSIGTLIFLKKTKKYKFIYWSFSVTATTLIIYSQHTIIDTLHYSDILWTVAVILFAFIGLGKNYGLFFLILHTLNIKIFILFFLNDHLEVLKIHTTAELILVALEVLFSFFVVSYLISQYLVFQNYAQNGLKKANKDLMNQNKIIQHKGEENKMLVKEIHHRVKNNLQIVISLLRMQSQEVQSQEAKKSFQEAIDRIMTISLIHQKLYNDKDITIITLENYLSELTGYFNELIEEKIDFEIKIIKDIKQIGINTIIPLGLLLNELISNSIKHSFQNEKNRQVNISFNPIKDSYFEMHYFDNGVWKENKKDGFGMELIQMLSEQLEGTFERDNTKYKFKLKNLDINL